jgi:MFS family permease
VSQARRADIRLRHWVGGGLSRNFWKLWAATAAGNLADGIGGIVLPLVAVRLTSSPAEIAGVAVAARIPALLFGLPAGGLADRLDRRWTMLAVLLLRFVVLGSLAVLALLGALSLPALYVSAFVLGTGEAFFDTNAQSIVPQLVPRERLVSANGRLFAAEMMMETFAGPILGGFLIVVSVPLAIGGSVAGYGLGVIGLLLLSGTFRPERTTPRRALHVEIGEGLGYLIRHRLLLTLTSMVAIGRLGSTAVFAVFALYAVAPGPMGLSEPQYGILFVTLGLGSLVGSLVTGHAVAIIGRARVLGLAQLLFGLAIGVPAITTNALVVAAAFLVCGASIMLWNITNVSLRQSIVPDALLGRVHASHRFIANVAGLVGAIVGGAVGEIVGLPAAFAIGSGIMVASVAGLLIVTEERIAAAERETGGQTRAP